MLEGKLKKLWFGEPELKHSLILSLPIFSYSLLSKLTSSYFQLFQMCCNMKGKSKVLRMTYKAAMSLLPDSWMTSSSSHSLFSGSTPVSEIPLFHTLVRSSSPSIHAIASSLPLLRVFSMSAETPRSIQFHEPGQGARLLLSFLHLPSHSFLCVSLALDVSPEALYRIIFQFSFKGLTYVTDLE